MTNSQLNKLTREFTRSNHSWSIPAIHMNDPFILPTPCLSACSNTPALHSMAEKHMAGQHKADKTKACMPIWGQP